MSFETESRIWDLIVEILGSINDLEQPDFIGLIALAGEDPESYLKVARAIEDVREDFYRSNGIII